MARSTTLKRLEGELKNLKRSRETYYQVFQDEEEKFHFYFMFKGDQKPYTGGYFIGKIMLPHDYPNNPGDIKVLTPSGRFKVDSKICLSNTGYHKESHSPIWTIEQIIVGFVSIFYDDKETGVSHIKDTATNRMTFSENSFQYNMQKYPEIMKKFDQFVDEDGYARSDKEIEQIIDDHMEKMRKKKEKKLAKEEKRRAKREKKEASKKIL